MADISVVLKLPDMASKYCAYFFSFKEKFMPFLLYLNTYDSGNLFNLLWIKTKSKLLMTSALLNYKKSLQNGIFHYQMWWRKSRSLLLSSKINACFRWFVWNQYIFPLICNKHVFNMCFITWLNENSISWLI